MRLLSGSCALFAWGILGLVGCTAKNPAYCDSAVEACGVRVDPDGGDPADLAPPADGGPGEEDLRKEEPPPDMAPACREPGDCASRVCLPEGRCAPADDVVYVDNRGGRCTGTHAGTLLDPVCTSKDALAVVQRTGKRRLSYAASSAAYDVLSLDNLSLSAHGPGAYAPVTARIAGGIEPALSVRSGGTVLIDGLDLTGSAGNVVSCQADPNVPALEILRSRVRDGVMSGIYSRGCKVIVRRTAVYNNDSRGVLSESNGELLVENSFVVWNGLGGVRGSTGAVRVRFSTLAYNGSLGVIGGVECGSGPGTRLVEGSILVDNGRPVPGSQVSSTCRLLRSAIDEEAFNNGAENRFRAAPEFISAQDFRLRRTPSSTACCIDQLNAVEGVSDVKVDFEGTARPQGARWDIGAHEVR